MEWIQLWAGITFAAQNGDVEGLLTAAAAGGLHLFDIVPRPSGFSARCAAWHYRKLAALARRRRVRLRIQKRRGLFFCIRPLLRRRGLWAGCLVFLPLLLWLQGFVWFVEPVGLTPGQQARAAVVLWEAGLFPGNAVTQEKLTAGEYALLQSGEFSWASLNFMKGKLVAEAAAAKPVPDIAAGTLHGLRARVSGTVVRTNLVSGTMLVVPGQAVEAGQGLIGTARAERDGTLIFQPAAGSVRAQFEWENEQDTALLLPIEQLTGQQAVHRTLFWDGHAIALPSLHPVPNSAEAAAIVRHYQPEALGLPVPIFIEEATYYHKVPTDLERTEEQALALARLQSKQALQQNWADFELLARKEDVSVEENTLHYRVVYTITADICK